MLINARVLVKKPFYVTSEDIGFVVLSCLHTVRSRSNC